MNYHKLKELLAEAAENKERLCSEHCGCRLGMAKAHLTPSEIGMRCRHGNMIALPIDLAESILRDLESLVP